MKYNMRMLKGKKITSAALLAAFIIAGISGCTEKPEPTTVRQTVHTTWQETTTMPVETTTETTTETTADPIMLRDPFVGKWVGILKVGNRNLFYTLVFNSDGTGSQSCSGNIQHFIYDVPDTAKKTMKVTSENGAGYTISYTNGSNASNKTYTFSDGMVVDCQVPSVDCLRVRATDPALVGTWVTGKGKKLQTLVFTADNIMKDKNGSVPYTIERTIDGQQVLRLLNGDIRYKVEGKTLTLETNNTDIEKEWTKKAG